MTFMVVLGLGLNGEIFEGLLFEMGQGGAFYDMVQCLNWAKTT